MKWTIIILVFLGLLAAFSASILVSALRVNLDKEEGSGEVVIAASSLPAMSVVTSEHIKLDTIPKEQLPEGYLTNSVQAIGRVLAVPMVEGQVLTGASFVTSGSEAQLAAALPYGMRAVSVTLPREAVTGGLLYPGCVVDVLASFRLSAVYKSKGQAISTTLLHGINVLAVEEKTIVSKQDNIQKGAPPPRTSSRVSVTLMLDPRQAEALQLAMRFGNVSLSLRNPLDKYPVDFDATVLSEGRLAKLGSILGSTVVSSPDGKGGTGGLASGANGLASLLGMLDANDPNFQIVPDYYSEGQRQALGIFSEGAQQPPTWVITVIRGTDVKEQELNASEVEE
jgi:Flp pilus assembly protein CpaB